MFYDLIVESLHIQCMFLGRWTRFFVTSISTTDSVHKVHVSGIAKMILENVSQSNFSVSPHIGFLFIHIRFNITSGLISHLITSFHPCPWGKFPSHHHMRSTTSENVLYFTLSVTSWDQVTASVHVPFSHNATWWERWVRFVLPKMKTKTTYLLEPALTRWGEEAP